MSQNFPFSDNDIDLFASSSTNALATTSDSRWRAMLFQLNDDGNWDEIGTGYSQVVKEVSRVFRTFLEREPLSQSNFGRGKAASAH